MAILKITKDNFESEVINSHEPILLDFWASWCNPCKMMGQVLEEIAASNPDARIGKVDVDEQPELASQFGVMSIPTLVMFKNGKPVSTSVGFRPKAAVEEMFK